MRLFERASLGSRGLAVVFGILCVVGLCLPAAWSTVTGDDQSSVGSGLYPAAHAITGARIIAAPGKVYDPGTIVVRRGIIQSVGPDKEVTVPYDAETIDGKGLVVYPGFLDLYTTIGQAAGVERSATGKGRPVDLAEAPLPSTPPDNRKGLTPEFEVAGALELNDGLADPRRRLGFTDLLSATAGAIATGQRRARQLERPAPSRDDRGRTCRPACQPRASDRAGRGCDTRSTRSDPRSRPRPEPPAQFFAPQAGENPYPRVLMGSIAHFRQAMLDGDHARTLETYYQAHGGPRPPFDPALKALQAVRSKRLAVWWEANSRDEINRALDLAEEFGTSAVIVGGKEAAKVVDRLKTGQVPVVLRLNFPVEPKVPTEEEYQAPACGARRTAEAPGPPQGRVEEAGRDGGSPGQGRGSLCVRQRRNRAYRLVPRPLRQLVTAGLTVDQALAGLTRNAAAIALVDKRLGTLEAGKLRMSSP